jgi:hypothetical protein
MVLINGICELETGICKFIIFPAYLRLSIMLADSKIARQALLRPCIAAGSLLIEIPARYKKVIN